MLIGKKQRDQNMYFVWGGRGRGGEHGGGGNMLTKLSWVEFLLLFCNGKNSCMRT